MSFFADSVVVGMVIAVEHDPLGVGDEYELVGESEPRIPWGRTGARLAVVQALYASDLTNRPASQCLEWVGDEFGLKGKQRRFAMSLVAAVESGRDRTDGLIDRFANWSSSEASELILRNVLRMACAELMSSGDASDAVVINEAVTVAKLLTTDGGGRFVNGVLGAIVRSAGF